ADLRDQDGAKRALAKYLKSYTTALEGKPTSEQAFRKAYIDAFAGTGTRTARESEPFFSRRQPTTRVGKQKPPRSDPRGLRRFCPELRAFCALRVRRRCSRECSQRAPSELDERRVGQLSRSLSCPVGRELGRAV